MAKQPAVYILTNKPNGTIYVGVTSNLARRLEDHRLRPKGSFTARYNLQRLVHVERFDDIEEAIRREKQLKGGSRAKKIALIERDNPLWKDLASEVSNWS